MQIKISFLPIPPILLNGQCLKLSCEVPAIWEAGMSGDAPFSLPKFGETPFPHLRARILVDAVREKQ